MTRRKILDLINYAYNGIAANRKFVHDVQSAIERIDQAERREASEWYKPSSLVCLRQMYFTRKKAEADITPSEYTAIGMADTGTRRHEAIQEVLIKMTKYGYSWKYLDVDEYVARKQSEGKCLSIQIKGRCGAETHLFDTNLKTSFRCDGIVENTQTNDFFLFEFKNQISFKTFDKNRVDAEHLNQVTCYCLSLDLDKALVLYENRDNCTLDCPEVLEVTEEMKKKIKDKIITCEKYVELGVIPPRHDTEKPCRWCKYKTMCRRAGA